MRKRSDSKDDRKARFKERAKRRAEEGAEFGSGDSEKNIPLDLSVFGKRTIHWYKPKKGINKIDILPFIVSQEWYEKLHERSGNKTGAVIGDIEPSLIIPIHYMPGSGDAMLCLKAFGKRENCPVCTELFNRLNNNEDYKGLQNSWRCFYNVYDYDDPDKGIQLWECAFNNFEKWLREAIKTDTEDGYPEYALIDEGKTIKFRGREKEFQKRTFIEAEAIEFIDRDPYDDSIYDKVFPLDKALIIPTLKQVQEKFHGMETEDEEIEEETEKPIRRSRKIVDEEPVEEEEVEDGADELPEHHMVKRSRKNLEDNDCPFGYNFGTDIGTKKECDEECPQETYDACSDELEKKEKPKRKRGRSI